MQPYFMPYIGYWQLLAAVDEFILYDNIQYTKKGWINRNRFLQNHGDALFTLPLKKDSNFLNIVDRTLSDDFDRQKLLRSFETAYRKAPFFRSAFPVLSLIVLSQHSNLFEYLHHSICVTAKYLEIKTPIRISSTLSIDHSLKSENKVISLCQAMKAKTYINTMGGIALYSKSEFTRNGIDLKFLKTKPITYQQVGNNFVDCLSIIDVMMFNSPDSIRAMLSEYELL